MEKEWNNLNFDLEYFSFILYLSDLFWKLLLRLANQKYFVDMVHLVIFILFGKINTFKSSKNKNKMYDLIFN